MARRLCGLLCVLGALLPLGGCAHSTGRCYSGRPCGSDGLNPDALPAIERGDLLPESVAPPLRPGALDRLGRPTGAAVYRRLRARECQCLAVESAATANLLDLEARAVLQQAASRKRGGDEARQAASLSARVLSFLALEDRNRAAAKALDLYYRLGEAEALWDLQQAALARVTDSLAKARDLKAKGVQVPIDDTALYRQQLDLQTRGVQAQFQIQQLNSELRRLLGFDAADIEWQLWPVDAFALTADDADPREAVAVALARRPDVLLLAALEDALCGGDPAAVSQQLKALHAALGQAMKPAKCPRLHQLLTALCDPCADDAQRNIRLEQLRLARSQRERDAAEEARQAVRALQSQADVVVLVQERAASWRAKVTEAEEREAKGLGSFAETTEAVVEWLQARRKVVEETANLQRARVLLRQAQGILPLDCYPPAMPDCAGGTCPRTGAGLPARAKVPPSAEPRPSVVGPTLLMVPAAGR